MVPLQAARVAAQRAQQESGGSVPSYPGLRRRIPSSGRLTEYGGVSPATTAAIDHGRDESPGRAQLPPGTRSLPFCPPPFGELSKDLYCRRNINRD